MLELTGTAGPPLIDMLIWVAGCCVLLVALAVYDIWRLRRRQKLNDRD